MKVTVPLMRAINNATKQLAGFTAAFETDPTWRGWDARISLTNLSATYEGSRETFLQDKWICMLAWLNGVEKWGGGLPELKGAIGWAQTDRGRVIQVQSALPRLPVWQTLSNAFYAVCARADLVSRGLVPAGSESWLVAKAREMVAGLTYDIRVDFLWDQQPWYSIEWPYGVPENHTTLDAAAVLTWHAARDKFPIIVR